MEAATNRLLSTVTGGDSFAYLILANVGPGTYKPMIVHSGEYPLSNIRARICDLNKFHKAIAEGSPTGPDPFVTIDELTPGMISGANIPMTAEAPKQDWNVFFSARNGVWTQMIRGRLINGEWKFALIVMRQPGDNVETIFSEIPHDFPQIGEQEFDAAKRADP